MPFQWDDAKYSVQKIPLLARIQKRLHQQAFNGAPPLTFKYYKVIFDKYNSHIDDSKMPADCRNEILVQKDLRERRNKYLHWNSGYGRSSIPIDPMFPKMVNDKRERLVLPG